MNVLYIQSDQHNPEYAGCYGHPLTRTPNIDRLAKRGTRFAWAYSQSPICSSTRAAMISGRYIHEIGVWDNVFAYNGTPRGWGHYFAEQGVHLASIGKLDFEPGREHGIEETRLAVHRTNLDVTSLFREQPILPRYDLLHKHRATGPADSLAAFASDIAVAEEAVRWLGERAAGSKRPWILIVNFNDLHRPWNPPRDVWDYYDKRVRLDDLDERFFESFDRLHPFHRTYARHHLGEVMGLEDMRRALIGYQGACEILDRQVGRVLEGLEAAGLAENTFVAYASDHGGTCGEHRNFDHGAMYEGSIRIPLIFAGPGVAAGMTDPTVVSAMDIFPTLCEAAGCEVPVHMRGVSLLGAIRGEQRAPRPEFALCEYHGAGYNGSSFMVRAGRFKLIECVGERPMLFDLEQDPLEMQDRVLDRPDDPETLRATRDLRRILYGLCCPEAVDARAKADQRAARKALAKDGRLFELMTKRGYERDPEHLVHRADAVPEGV